MNIYVIRHGQTELNKKGIINGHLEDPLTQEGIEQAQAAALLLPKNIKRIYSSSLERARQTAEILNKELELPITFHDELKEVNFGDLNGTTFTDEYRERHRTLTYDWRPSGESVEDVKRRVVSILTKISAENGDKEALIVAHGGIIRLLYFLQFDGFLDTIGNVSLHDFDLDIVLKKS